MKFYLAVDGDGKTWIKPTKEQIKDINDQSYQQIDIPTDQAGLMAWVQQMLDEILNNQPTTPELPRAEGPIAEVISETLYDLIGLGGGDSETIAEYTSRLVSLVEAEKDSVTPPLDPTKPVSAVEPKILPPSPQVIQEWLLDTATQREIEMIYTAIGCRIGELLRENRS